MTEHEQYLRFLVERGWKQKLKPQFDWNEQQGEGRTIYSELLGEWKARGIIARSPWVEEEEYHERLEMETRVILSGGHLQYFLIVSDVSRFARQHGIARGDGRGSVCGSLCAYLLDLHGVDPLRHQLLFERFLNEFRVDTPDIDLDFDDHKRDQIFAYLQQKYGHEHMAWIATCLRLRGRMALQDVARAFGVPLKETALASQHLLSAAKGDARADHTIEDSLSAPGFKEYVEKYPVPVHHAMRLEGAVRGIGEHAGGIVLSRHPLKDIVPLMQKGGRQIVALEKGECEALGLLKIDILAVRSIRVMAETFDLIRARHDPSVCSCHGCEAVKRLRLTEALNRGDYATFVERLPLEDPEVLSMLGAGLCAGCMQLESPGLLKLMKRLPVRYFSTIKDAISVFRPGVMRAGELEPYVRRLRGEEEIPAVHPIYDRIVAPTYGVVVLQEQITAMFHELGGVSLAQADEVRRVVSKSMGKEVFQRYEEMFVLGAIKKECSPDLARVIFNKMSEAGGYGFNSSHAVGYAQNGVKQAWLKFYYPAEFFCVCLNSTGRRDKISGFVRESKALGLPVRPPEVNLSTDRFVIRGEGKTLHLRAGFETVHGVGEKAKGALIDAQNDGQGMFRDLLDFIGRVNRRLVNKGVIESLFRAGTFESFYPNAQPLLDGLPMILLGRKKDALAILEALEKGRGENEWGKNETTLSHAAYLSIPPDSSLVACYAPLYQEFSPTLRFQEIGEFKREEEYPVALLRCVVTAVETKLKEGKEDEEGEKESGGILLGMASLVVEDDTDFCMVGVDPETYERNREVIDRLEGEVAILRVTKRANSDKLLLLEASPCKGLQKKLAGGRKDLTPFESYLLEDPLAAYEGVKERFRLMALSEAVGRMGRMRPDETLQIWGIVVSRNVRRTKKGKEFAVLTLENEGTIADILFWEEALMRYREILMKEKILVARVHVSRPAESRYGWKFMVDLRKGDKVVTVADLERRMNGK